METLNEDYVRTARAKGAPEWLVLRSHVLRNAMLPISTIIGLQVGLLLSGAVLTETRYLFPWYNNATTGGLQSQLRFGNVGTDPTVVTVTIGGDEKGTYPLDPNESMRVTYDNVDAGPVEVRSSGGVPIISSMRINLKTLPSYSSYSEFMGLSVGSSLGMPGNELSSTYWFPWYNNATTGGLSSQLRFGVP